MNKYVERIYNGIIKENPTFVIMLGMCPTLAVTTSGNNGLYMGLTTTVVLAASNFLISLLRKVIPDKVRIPAYIVLVASLVTIVQLALEAYLPVVNELLGIYIPLIVVNCIILGRAEAYAAKNPIGVSFFDGIGMGLGFTCALTIIGSFRELLGAGSVFGFPVAQKVMNLFDKSKTIEPVTIFILAPGALLTMAILTAIQNKLKLPSATNVPGKDIGCGGDCSRCHGSVCTINREQIASKEEIAAAKENTAKKTAASEQKESKED